ncbi:sensor histidine kinase [Paraburkholderia graminis]|uniref:sensor histidine kinase n=1 Tax=Paraburkholderia graminis TaxID=60548 RepID=UPI00286CDA1E|nr:HAMP domain-containing sensor histidine kinase [Paraburkholderia graminis]
MLKEQSDARNLTGYQDFAGEAPLDLRELTPSTHTLPSPDTSPNSTDRIERKTGSFTRQTSIARCSGSGPAVDVRLDTAARECIIAHKADASSKGIELSVAGDAYVTIEAPHAFVRIMLDNLVDNAIKYGEAGCRVEIVTRQTPEAMLLLVRDNGRGVTEQDRERLSDRFFRTADARQSGSGLRLSIVARIVDRLGGS